jgi:hypothetical protein
VEIAFDAPVAAPVGLTVATNIVVERARGGPDRAAHRARNGPAGDGRLPRSRRHGPLRAVTVVDWPAARLIVTDGLSEGDVLIIDAAGIADGQAVTTERP